MFCKVTQSQRVYKDLLEEFIKLRVRVESDQFDVENEGGSVGDTWLRGLKVQREQSRICSDFAESRTKKTAGLKGG